MKKTLFLLIPIALLAACGEQTQVKEDGAETIITQKESNEELTDAEVSEQVAEEAGDEQVVGPKKYRVTLLDQEKEKLIELEEKAQNGTQNEMVEATTEINEKWNAEVDKMYEELNEELTEEEMVEFSIEQEQWLEERENKAMEEAMEFEGGSMEALQLVSTKARMTEERAYEIADKYFQ